MPTLTQVRNAVDAFLSSNLTTITARQENFRTNTGRYWQGLKTHSSTPAYTNAVDGSSIGDRLNLSPDDQGQFSTWLNVFPEWAATALPCAVTVDVYQGPQGHGWVITIEITHNGDTWRRVVNVGPESYRSRAWFIVPPLP